MGEPGSVVPVDLVLHLGPGKTGTTTIQRMLRQHRAELARQGVLYPVSPGQERHTKFGLSFRGDAELAKQPAWSRMRPQSPERFRRRVHRLLRAEIAEAGLPCVLISDEALFNLGRDALERLRRFTDSVGARVRPVVYLRRQDDHLLSLYQQQVKIGETRRLTEWAAGDRTRIYDYARRLADWRDVVFPSTFAVRRFEPSAFRGGSLEADFLAAAKVSGITPSVTARSNESLDAETVEFLRVFNLYEVERHGESPGVMDHRHLTSALAGHSDGPTLTLPPAQLESFMARWQEPNERVAREHFGEPELFPAPRRTRTTTHLQVLDPARVDHFADLCGLPEAVREDLRSIAAREAQSFAARSSGR
ncbi:hypothetical protein [Nocardioides antri]|uniref:Sulfotransferase family protein n=1 Tax=Nocardioides antri TaxID=2607659 RepID=A0A5B1M3H2_9ACTN|nr:hypothetical protein [Nocardioides antri]KAA1426300.1 hypothetical protein F0U47_15490 [Nocardioides antri]